MPVNRRRLLGNERDAVGGSSPWIGPVVVERGAPVVAIPLVAQARAEGRRADPRTRRLVAEAHVLSTVGQQLVRRVADRVAHGKSEGPDGAVLKLARGVTEARLATIALELAGTNAVVAAGPDVASTSLPPALAPAATSDAGPRTGSPADQGVAFLMRQTRSLAGGSNEMQRNLISERLLGMPREPAPDAAVPFSQVRAGRTGDEGERR